MPATKKGSSVETMILHAFQARGFSARDAKREAKDLVRDCGAYSLKQGWGDEVLRGAQQGDPKALGFVEGHRVDGVQDEDIRWYWNLSDFEKYAIYRIAEMDKMVMFINAMEDAGRISPDLTKDEYAEIAMRYVRKYRPMYGDPSEDNETVTGNDARLPTELKDRVDRYIEGQARRNAVGYKALIEGSSSFNALVRTEIGAGRL